MEKDEDSNQLEEEEDSEDEDNCTNNVDFDPASTQLQANKDHCHLFYLDYKGDKGQEDEFDKTRESGEASDEEEEMYVERQATKLRKKKKEE